MRVQPLPPTDELEALLTEAGVELPPSGPSDEARRALLALALHVADREKRVRFTSASGDFSWRDPGFSVKDEKVAVELPFLLLEARDADGIASALAGRAAQRDAPNVLLAVDARPTGFAEYEWHHLLYGEVTLHAWPHKPRESKDPRIDAAREAGWVKTLKERNLLPGRGLVVPDQKHGLFLKDPRMEAVRGMIVLLASGEITFDLNPFARDADSDLQHWLAWGRGVAASEWRELLHVERADDDAAQW